LIHSSKSHQLAFAPFSNEKKFISINHPISYAYDEKYYILAAMCAWRRNGTQKGKERGGAVTELTKRKHNWNRRK
jgi:hypothetical protein